MKKLLYLPLLVPGGASEQVDLEAAFRKKYDVKILDHYNTKQPMEKLVEIVMDFKPDYVHVQYSDRINLDVVEKLRKDFPKTIWTHWTGDARREPIPHIVTCGKVMDATFLATGIGQKEKYERLTGKPVFYWQHAAADWQFLDPLPEESKTDVVMVGNIYGREVGANLRISLARTLTKLFPTFTAYGGGYPTDVRKGGSIPWKQQSELFNRAALTIGPNAFWDIEGYWSDRPLIAMAAGTTHLWHEVPGSPFEDWRDCVYWLTVEDVVGKIGYLLERPELRRELAHQGQVAIKKAHTFDTRVEEYEAAVSTLTV
jgi:hypothetical protein